MRVVFGASLLAIAAGAAAPPARAQRIANPPAVEESAADIVVTARRREERLLDVPVAVTAYSAETLNRLGVVDLSNVQGTSPNVNIVQGRGSSTNANIFIRGVGQPDALQTFDPAVGVYVDGVYISRIQGALFNLYDVERVEVLRGPQGTLYGKNTIGGAVNIVSRKPNLSEFTGDVSVGYGEFNQVLANAYVSAPLVDGKLGASLAAVYDTRDGLVTDPLTGRRYNDRDTFAGRAILRFEPAENFSATLAADYTRVRSALTLGYPTAPLSATRFVPPGAVTLVPANPYGAYDFRASTSFRGNEGQRLDHTGVNFTLNWEFAPDLKLVSITGFRNLRAPFFIDIDASQAELGDVLVDIDQEQISQELQLQYSGERLSGVFGLYYLNELVRSHQEAYADDLFQLTATIPISFLRLIDDDQRLDSYAAFGQATYRFTDRLSLTAGIRYTHERKQYTRFTTTRSSLAALNNLNFGFPANLPPPFNTDDDVDFDDWSPTFQLSYKPAADLLIYASASRGFKSGGFNGRVNSLADVTQVVGGVPTIVPFFKPETVWTYEGGIKGALFDRKLTFAANGFYSDYENFQARVGGGRVGAGAGSFPVLNAGKLVIWGLEAEVAARPFRGANLSATAGYLNARYDRFDDNRRPPLDAFSCNPTGQRVTCRPAFTPPYTASIQGSYAIDLGADRTLTLGGDARFVGEHFLSVDNRRPGLFEDGYAIANFFAEYSAPEGYYLRFNLRNAFDETYKTDGQEFSSVGNIQTAYFGDPRTWMVTGGVRF